MMYVQNYHRTMSEAGAEERAGAPAPRGEEVGQDIHEVVEHAPRMHPRVSPR
ncbi:hypothetical protein [Streptomyces bobili]|uniref:hypothetical protein n=1 Tax=Streptomyces bobili TaxID=67280 RepID=UPI003799AF27